jgi:hypothetical protein
MKAASLLALSVSVGVQGFAGAQAPNGAPAPAGAHTPTSGQPANRSGCSLHLEITDEDGKALPKAFVLVHGEHGSNQPLTPDKTGQVKTNLHAGMYDLFISASGFEPQAQILDLRSCKPLDLNLMLKIDSEHSEPEGL